MPSVRVGIIGTGIHGSRYANHIINDVEGLDLVALARRSDTGKQQAADWNVSYYSKFQDLIADDSVDAVIAVTPPSLNLEIAKCCIEERKPLLLEKPLAINGAAAGKIVRLFRDHDLKLTVGQTLRYNPVVLALKENIGRLGTLYSISANQRLEPSSLGWHEKIELAGAGVSIHTAVHVFDTLRFISGKEIKRVVAHAAKHHNSKLEDLIMILLEMTDGVTAIVDCSKVGAARSGRYEFVGHDGQLWGDQVHNRLELVQGTHCMQLGDIVPASTIVPLLTDWQKYLAGEGDNPITGEDGLKAVQACEACLQSAATTKWVDVEQG